MTIILTSVPEYRESLGKSFNSFNRFISIVDSRAVKQYARPGFHFCYEGQHFSWSDDKWLLGEVLDVVCYQE